MDAAVSNSDITSVLQTIDQKSTQNTQGLVSLLGQFKWIIIAIVVIIVIVIIIAIVFFVIKSRNKQGGSSGLGAAAALTPQGRAASVASQLLT
jgi:uncharacterized membrane protein